MQINIHSTLSYFKICSRLIPEGKNTKQYPVTIWYHNIDFSSDLNVKTFPLVGISAFSKVRKLLKACRGESNEGKGKKKGSREVQLHETQGKEKEKGWNERKCVKITRGQQCSRKNCAVWQMNCSAGNIFISMDAAQRYQRGAGTVCCSSVCMWVDMLACVHLKYSKHTRFKILPNAIILQAVLWGIRPGNVARNSRWTWFVKRLWII